MFQKIKHCFEMVKFSHSVFALPFALASLLFASQGFPPLRTFILIVLAMVFARNTAMAFNRLIDANLDAQNPRTAVRHIPKGLLSKEFVLIFIVINALLFIATASFFNPLTLWLSPVALFILCFYSLTKRWTHFTQLFLGLSLGIAPIGAWIAVKGTLEAFPLILGVAVMFWVAGFDLIYATQDYDFDREKGLKSLVVRLGIHRALWLSRLLHLLTVILLAALGIIYHLGLPYVATVLVITVFLAYEQSLVRANDLSRVNAAFFNINGIIGIIFLAGMILELFS